jgi:hypothetical protein
MMPYGTYQLWQAERARTDAEHRQAAGRQGQIAAAVAGRSRDIVRPARAVGLLVQKTVGATRTRRAPVCTDGPAR